MINFDGLPKTTGNYVIPAGVYTGVIEKAEMKMPKDETKAPYLNITWNLTDKTGKSFGKFFDILTDSDKRLVQHKLYQFINALGINLGSTFELRDLAKVVTGKTALLKIVVDTKSNPDQPRNQIDIFSDNCYMPINSDVPFPSDANDLPFKKESAPDSNSAESY